MSDGIEDMKKLLEALPFHGQSEEDKKYSIKDKHIMPDNEAHDDSGRSYWDYWVVIDGVPYEINVAQDNGEMWITKQDEMDESKRKYT